MTLHNFLSMRKDRIYAPSGFMDVDDGLGNTRGVGETIQVGGVCRRKFVVRDAGDDLVQGRRNCLNLGGTRAKDPRIERRKAQDI